MKKAENAKAENTTAQRAVTLFETRISEAVEPMNTALNILKNGAVSQIKRWISTAGPFQEAKDHFNTIAPDLRKEIRADREAIEKDARFAPFVEDGVRWSVFCKMKGTSETFVNRMFTISDNKHLIVETDEKGEIVYNEAGQVICINGSDKINSFVDLVRLINKLNGEEATDTTKYVRSKLVFGDDTERTITIAGRQFKHKVKGQPTGRMYRNAEHLDVQCFIGILEKYGLTKLFSGDFFEDGMLRLIADTCLAAMTEEVTTSQAKATKRKSTARTKKLAAETAK